MQKGQRIRFTTGNLGVMRSPNAGRTVPDHIVKAGDIGFYFESIEVLGEGWHMATISFTYPVPIDGKSQDTFYVPVHESMFEAVGDA